jgi:hypothetical protein
MTFDYNVFQAENKIWVEKMFHSQCLETSFQPLEGIIEEIGELQSAVTEEDVEDAVGDIMVFMADFCSCMDIKLEDVIKPFDICIPQTNHGIICLVGRLCHSHLKFVQNIRTNENHIVKIKTSLREIVDYIRYKVQDFESTIEKVWNEVKQRDWNKYKIDGTENGKD